MDKISRRHFFKKVGQASVTGAIVLALGKSSVNAAVTPRATVIDLTKCDGCISAKIPSCVAACRVKNMHRFPEPAQPIPDYWPRKGFEDWSDKRNVINRLTPYNWIYVQPVQVEGKTMHIVRRCMHCDNAPCARLCPFSAIEINQDKSVIIDEDVCFGGAKCRDNCPWGIPARQAGVGLYMKIAPQYGGGGVMYKCDQCHDLIEKGEQPACISACPKGAMTFGGVDAMKKLAEDLRRSMSGYIYGLQENGGTSVFYVSPVSFEIINKAMHEQGVIDGKPGRPGMPTNLPNKLDELEGWGKSMIVAPIASMFAAGWAAYKSLKGRSESTDQERTDENG